MSASSMLDDETFHVTSLASWCKLLFCSLYYPTVAFEIGAMRKMGYILQVFRIRFKVLYADIKFFRFR